MLLFASSENFLCWAFLTWHMRYTLLLISVVPTMLSISFNETVALPDSTVQPVCSVIEGDHPVSFSWSSPGGSDLASSHSYNT